MTFERALNFHRVARWLGAACALVAAVALFSCSSKPELIGNEPGGSGGKTGTADGGSGSTPIFTGDGSPGPSCRPKTCADIGAECGETLDGCGGRLECGTCPAGQGCSVVTANKCTDLTTLCKPRTQSEACDGKECGLEGDGCGASLDCGTCSATEACGIGSPFACDAVPTNPDPNNCPAKITSCASVGARCGVIGNGCGGTIDCTAELGACPAGQFCGAVTPYQCGAPGTCTPAASCAALGWACGTAVDSCGVAHDCAAEGRRCGPFEACVGGITGPTRCQAGAGGPTCPLCGAVPNCTGRPQVTRLVGRVVTPGRTDGDQANQVGVPNAYVYILRSNDPATLPAIPTGIPTNGTRCDRCDQQELGPILGAATTNATGGYVIEGNVPVGQEFVLVVKVGKFRRAVRHTIPAASACTTINLPAQLPANPTRLPRHMTDGLAVNIPKIAITTGIIDAMECVFSKMGLANSEFGNPGPTANAAARLHMYRGGPAAAPGGASMDGSTPHDSALYPNLARMLAYDMVVADCEGQQFDGAFAERDAYGANVREFVNRGGRLFASHLSFSWLHENGTTPYAAGTAIQTGLGPAATWDPGIYTDTSGTGQISRGRPRASPRIQTFADWAAAYGVAGPPNYTFNITDPRSNNTGLGASTEEFVHRTNGNQRTQQLSFNTPYGAPAAAACGRVAYSGFHVTAGGGDAPYANAVFPNHCGGNLTAQEKVLLFMLFDLGACVGQLPPPPTCTPVGCQAGACGLSPNGCGGTVNCGPCPPNCRSTTCAAQGAECGSIGDSCGKILNCGVCEAGKVCGAGDPNKCGGVECKKRTCEEAEAECGNIGDGCGGLVECGECPPGEVCGLESPNKCSPPECTKTTCDEQNAECGNIGDGCGNVIDCGPCPPGEVCGRIEPNRCDGIQ